MGSWGNADITQIKELQKKVQAILDGDIDKICMKCAKQLAQRLLRKVEKRTPVGVYAAESGVTGGNLSRKWTIGNVAKTGNLYTIEVINQTEYASYVEFGHRQTPGRYVPVLGKRLKKGWVNGRFMLTISEKEIKAIAPSVLEKKLAAMLKEALDG